LGVEIRGLLESRGKGKGKVIELGLENKKGSKEKRKGSRK
jgi:hypothetical protein